MRRPLILAALTACLLLGPLAAPAPLRAEDEPETLVTRVFDVGALLAPRPQFLRMQVGTEGDPSDEESPLFGAESEEGTYPLGQIDELIEQIQSWVRPETWQATLGAFLAGHGERYLVVRSFPDVVDAVAAHLGEQERRVGRVIALDVEALRLEPQDLAALRAKAGEEGLNLAALTALRASAKAGPSASFTAYERESVTLFTGRQRAYVAEYDCEVAQKAHAYDPIVRVSTTGLALRAQLTLDESGARGLLYVDLGLAERRELRVVDDREGGPMQVPAYGAATSRTRVPLVLGRYALIDGQASAISEGWSFVVRARALQQAAAVPARGLELVSPPEHPARRFAERSYDIAILQESVASRMGQSINLVPSNFTPPEPPELREPAPIWAGEGLMELMRRSVMPASWDLSGTGMQVGWGWLRARNVPAALDAIGQNLELLRRELLGAVETEVRFVQVPLALAQALIDAPDRLLDARLSEGLSASLAQGESRVLGVATVACIGGARNVSVSGSRIDYVADQELEIAEEAFANNPVLSRILSGASVDVEAQADASRTNAQSVLRLARSEVFKPLESVQTAIGVVETPELSLLRLDTMLEAPLGRTLVAAVAGSGPTREVVLVVSRR